MRNKLRNSTKNVFEEKSKNDVFNIASNPDEEINIATLGEMIWKLINGENSNPKLNCVAAFNL